jgi:myo-inositol-1(or 4)-monophosphatase
MKCFEILGRLAGIVILQEAGGFVTGSKDVLYDGIVTEAILTDRRYLVIRGVAETPVRKKVLKLDCTANAHNLREPINQEESSIKVQKRIVREFYDTVEDTPSTNKNQEVAHGGL